MREKSHSKTLHGFKGKSNKYLEYRSAVVTRQNTLAVRDDKK